MTFNLSKISIKLQVNISFTKLYFYNFKFIVKITNCVFLMTDYADGLTMVISEMHHE